MLDSVKHFQNENALGIMENRLDEAEQRLLEDDLLAACPPVPENAWSGEAVSVSNAEARRPLRIIQVRGEEPVAYYDEQDIPPEFADNAVKLGNLAAWEPLFAFQAAFQLLERRYPLRAAALYLRSLTRIWVELVEKNTLDLMRDDDFLRLYLKALLQSILLLKYSITPGHDVLSLRFHASAVAYAASELRLLRRRGEPRFARLRRAFSR